MGNKFGKICYCDSYCLNKEIKTEPDELNEESSMLKKKKTAQFYQYKVSNIVSETINSTRRLKTSEENIILNTAKNTNTISSNKELSFDDAFSCITINSILTEKIEGEEEEEEEKDLEIKKEKDDELNLNLLKSANNNIKKNLFNKTSIISIKKFKRLLTLPVEKEVEKEESDEDEDEKEENKEVEMQNEVIEYRGEVCTFIGELTNKDPLIGKGKLLLNSGETLEGCFINGKLNKHGKYIDENGNIFEGYFQDGILNGKGTIIKLKLIKDKNKSKDTLEEIKYTGDIKNFLKEGYGEEICKEYIYEGNFHNDLKDGKGRIKYFQTGDLYEGEFKDDKINGQGTYIWKNKCQYTGEFKNGEMNGEGKFTWPNGSEYEGDYVKGIREGFGTFTWSNGKVFKGVFKRGKPKGKGIVEYGGIKYNAFYQNGSFKKCK